MKTFRITEEQMNLIYGALKAMPWQNVNGVIGELSRLPEIKADIPKAEPKKEK